MPIAGRFLLLVVGLCEQKRVPLGQTGTAGPPPPEIGVCGEPPYGGGGSLIPRGAFLHQHPWGAGALGRARHDLPVTRTGKKVPDGAVRTNGRNQGRTGQARTGRRWDQGTRSGLAAAGSGLREAEEATGRWVVLEAPLWRETMPETLPCPRRRRPTQSGMCPQEAAEA